MRCCVRSTDAGCAPLSCARRSLSTSYRSEMSGSVAGRVAVVTDSTAYLPRELAAGYDIRVVPLQVTIGDRSGDEGTEITYDDVTAALVERGATVVTSRPTPERFAEVYADAHANGA